MPIQGKGLNLDLRMVVERFDSSPENTGYQMVRPKPSTISSEDDMDYKEEIRSWLRMHKANAYCDLNPCLRCQLAEHMLVEPTSMEEAEDWYRKARRMAIGGEIKNDDVLEYIVDVLQTASLKY